MHLKLGFSTNAFDLHLTVHEWVNDGLMAVFFLLVGLEIKREMLVGELSTPQRAALPAFAALGGMLAPAAVCAAFVWSNPDYRPGWAIPAATDITFALAALAFAAPGVPRPVRIFFTALAVIDDLGAILIIAFFYTYALVLPMLLAAAGIFALLMALNRLRVTNLLPYLVLGVAMWFCVLESGIHATLAGIALAFAIPIRGNALPGGHVNSPLKRLEHAIKPYVAFGIVPLFARESRLPACGPTFWRAFFRSVSSLGCSSASKPASSPFRGSRSDFASDRFPRAPRGRRCTAFRSWAASALR